MVGKAPFQCSCSCGPVLVSGRRLDLVVAGVCSLAVFGVCSVCLALLCSCPACVLPWCAVVSVSGTLRRGHQPDDHVENKIKSSQQKNAEESTVSLSTHVVASLPTSWTGETT